MAYAQESSLKCGLHGICQKKASAEQAFPGEKSLWPDQ